jgi:TolB-like protein
MTSTSVLGFLTLPMERSLPSRPHSARVAFDRFELDLRSGELRKEGRRVRLQAQPFQLLALLIENAGEIVTREEAWRTLWQKETFVDFDHGVAVVVNKLREALGDSVQKPRFIETLPKRGYRFIARIEPPAGFTEDPPSIAVLPFVNMTADKGNEYFGDGLAEEIINALAQMKGLMVAGRTSSFYFRDKDVELGEIGRCLNVQYILEGSVQRSGNHVRVTAQLIKVSDGFHTWSARYDRELTDLFGVQDEITRAIAEALRLKLSPEAGTPRRRQPELAAYEAYLKARDQLIVRPSQGSAAASKQCLESAIQLDPKFALPYGLLGVYYTVQAFWAGLSPREAIRAARAAEQEALRIDPSLPEAHAMLGCCAGMEFSWREAEQHWNLAMTREPVPPDVLFWYANHFLLPVGRVSEAVDLESKVLEHDPLNFLYRHHWAVALRHLGKLQEAEAELRRVLEVDGQYPLALGTLGSICARQGRLEEALKFTEAAYARVPLAPFCGQLAALLMSAGATSRSNALIDGLKSGVRCDASVGLTIFHGMLGQFAQAAEFAEQAIEERYTALIAIVRPLLQASPQWPALAKQMNLISSQKSQTIPRQIITPKAGRLGSRIVR